jgi:DNA-directed RNA polymerase subunit RPC12/RpoP
MNTGFKCEECGRRLVDAHLLKLPSIGLYVKLRCRTCGNNDDVGIDLLSDKFSFKKKPQ